MKTIIHRAATALFLGLLPAGILCAAQVTVTTPPAGGNGVNVQAGPTNVQAGPGGANVAVPPGTGAAIRDNAAARQENRIERRGERQADRAANNNWRMQNYNNRWWYYHPNNTWSYYQGGRWMPYRAVDRPYTANQVAPGAARRYSSGYRGPMNDTAPAPNANPLPQNKGAYGKDAIHDNTPGPGVYPLPGTD
jgi:hypothetical protein